jgi:hypothetical protein
MKTNNLQNKCDVRATLTSQSATAVAAKAEAQHFRRQRKPAASIDFDQFND